MANLLEAHNIVKNYASHRALNDVSINIPKGQVCGLLGPNGAGKTSFIRIITQITGADSGHILFDGQPLAAKHTANIGYLPEERGLYKKMPVGEHLLYLAKLKGMSSAEAMKRVKDWFIRFGIQEWWHKNVEDLSKGMQQKVQFVATVLHEPQLLILDEPFSGFDPINANLVKDEILRLKEQGTTIIFSTHRMESVEEMCDNIVLINNAQKVLDGSTKEIRNQFKTNTFSVEGVGILPELPSVYRVLSEEKQGQEVRAQIQLPPTEQPNQLLGLLLPHLNIHKFVEQVPSINDIFIQKVTETNSSKSS
jgi:ABC-2 type transport system ATP-binding protein